MYKCRHVTLNTTDVPKSTGEAQEADELEIFRFSSIL